MRTVRRTLLCLSTLPLVYGCAAPPEESDVVLGEAEQGVLYGTDDRVEVKDHPDPAVRAAARSAGIVVSEEKLIRQGDDVTLDTRPLHEVADLCIGSDGPSGDKYELQPSMPTCSAFLLSPTIVAMSGHCLPKDKYEDADGNTKNHLTKNGMQIACGAARFIFNYELGANGAPVAIKSDDVYTCRQSANGRPHYKRFACDGSVDPRDFAIFELDRPVRDKTGKIVPGLFPADTLGLLPGQASAVGQPIAALGHPMGIWKKVTPGEVTDPTSYRLYHDADTFDVNSGSAVIDLATMEVVGIHTAGPAGYTDKDLGGGETCRVMNVLPEGSKLSSAGRVEQMLGSYTEKLGLLPWLDPQAVQADRVLVGDADADGKEDLIAIHHSAPSSATYAYLSTGSAFAPAFYPGSMSGFYQCHSSELCLGGDVTGDGAMDIVAIAQQSNGPRPPGVYVSRSIGTKPSLPNQNLFVNMFPPTPSGPNWDTGTTLPCKPGEICKLADVDGDHRADLVAITTFFMFDPDLNAIAPPGTVYVSRAKADHFGPREPLGSFCVGLNGLTCSHIQTADVDGDARFDLVGFAPSGIVVARWKDVMEGDIATAQITLGPTEMWMEEGCYPTDTQRCLVADATGDGRADVIQVKQLEYSELPGTSMTVAEAREDHFRTNGQLWAWASCTMIEQCLPGDFDGDGRFEVAGVKTDGGSMAARVGLTRSFFE